MKFLIPTMHHSKVNRRTHAHTQTQTDRPAESNMPFQLFQIKITNDYMYNVKSLDLRMFAANEKVFKLFF